MTIEQELQKIQRQLDKLAKQTEKLTASVAKQEAKKGAKPKATRAARKKSAPKKTAAPKKAAAKKSVKTTATAPVSVSAKISDAEKVIGAIKESKDGIDTKSLMQKTGFNAKKISNILYKATKSGKIKAVKRGVYAAV